MIGRKGSTLYYHRVIPQNNLIGCLIEFISICVPLIQLNQWILAFDKRSKNFSDDGGGDCRVGKVFYPNIAQDYSSHRFAPRLPVEPNREDPSMTDAPPAFA